MSDSETEKMPSQHVIRALTALLSAGHYAQCETEARVMATKFPRDPSVWQILGMCLAGTGRSGEALALIRKAIDLNPSNAYAHNNLGYVLSQLGRLDEARECFRRALTLKPNFAEACNNLGHNLNSVGRLTEAEACYRRALAFQPQYLDALNNLGIVLRGLGRYDEAEASYRRALALKPDNVQVLTNLGVLLSVLDRESEAEECLRRAVALQPDYAPAHNNLGNVLRNLGRLTEAEVCYRRALALKPDFVTAYSGLLFCLNFSGAVSGLAFDEARRYGQCVTSLASRPYTRWSCEASPARLRVGLVSGDLRSHVVFCFLEGVLREIDRSRIELIAYPTQPREDQHSKLLRAHFAAWTPLVGLADQMAAARIQADGIHILIDLSGHTEYNRLPMFAWKPAPVQASWLGYLATTGLEAMDYLIADPWTLSEEAETGFVERIWRLPESYLCFTPPAVNVEVSSLPALQRGHITFGSFNNLTKLTDASVALWARVLAGVPDSRLYLKSKQLGAPAMREQVLQRFAAHDIAPERLILQGPVAGHAAHLAAYERVDIALDPVPYPGITTSAEALWMGVPVLTLAGDRFLSRQGVGLLSNAGLSDWVASDPDDYVARAVSHAGDLSHLAALRATLRERFVASPVCDAKRFSRNFEQALEAMWRAYAGGKGMRENRLE
jgi:protein O-GlcNAc transferase